MTLPEDVDVLVELPDGRRRVARLPAEEARALWRRGRDVGRGGVARRTARILAPAVKWVAVTVVAAIFGAEISGQYAARQREVELEAELITEISVASVTLYQDAQNAARDRTDGQRQMREDAADAWVLSSSSVDFVLLAYYGGEDVTEEWDAYQEAMYDWVVLACCTTDGGRPENIGRIRAYVDSLGPGGPPPPADDPWAAMDTATPSEKVYQWVGLQLLRGRGALLEDLSSSTPDLD